MEVKIGGNRPLHQRFLSCNPPPVGGIDANV
jgi:hypothetical protein